VDHRHTGVDARSEGVEETLVCVCVCVCVGVGVCVCGWVVQLMVWGCLCAG